MRTQTKVYRLLLFAYPASHRREYSEPMTQMFVDRLRDGGGGPYTVRLWFHLLVDLGSSVFAEHGRSLSRSVRDRPNRVWGALLAIGALIGASAAAVLATMAGRATGAAASRGHESSLWMVAAFVVILTGFLGTFLRIRPGSSVLLTVGVVVTAVGHLPVIAHEAAVAFGMSGVSTVTQAFGFVIMLGIGLVGVGMTESPGWSRLTARSTLAILLFPLTLIVGYTAVVDVAGGSEVVANYLFRGGYFLTWIFFGVAITVGKNALAVKQGGAYDEH